MKLLLSFALLCGMTMGLSAAAQDQSAAQLYNKGIQLIEAGKADQGRTALKELVEKYPGTAFAKLAKESLDKPVVGSITYKDVSPLTEREIRKRLEVANAQLMVGKVYQQEGADQARNLIAALLIKKGVKVQQKIADILITAKEVEDRKMAITISIVKK